jgi:hypothetical protein
VSRSSQMISFAPPSSSHVNLNGSNLDDVVSSAHMGTSGRKIGIKDRIACYRWTYFTMVPPDVPSPLPSHAQQLTNTVPDHGHRGCCQRLVLPYATHPAWLTSIKSANMSQCLSPTTG